jgi:hypothetical protein
MIRRLYDVRVRFESGRPAEGFLTEAKEAEWWDSHPEIATDLMKQALKAGKAKRTVQLESVTMRSPGREKGASLPDLY